MNLIQRIDALLPQTQCGKCGHPGCKPYAEGIASGEAINKCPPGGDETIAALSQLLNASVIALDNERGNAPAQVAFIREAECIGCTKCIQVCPVDAILGAAKLMHTVIIDECTGCDLCVAPCPVDCIDMRPLPSPGGVPLVGGLAFDETQRGLRAERRGRARQRFEARSARLRRQENQRQVERMLRERKSETPAATTVNTIQAALEQSRLEGAVDSDAALKQARTHVAMSRAQLNKSLKAFGHPPIAQQAARLVALQKEYDEAERVLEALLESATVNLLTREKTLAKDAVISAADKAALNRAKIQLAMRRAALKKAQTAESPLEQIAALSDEVSDAEQILKALEALDSPASHQV